jgi:hypothetical protein
MLASVKQRIARSKNNVDQQSEQSNQNSSVEQSEQHSVHQQYSNNTFEHLR